MKLQAAKKLVSLLEQSIAEAEIAGRDSVELVEGAKSLDDDARQALVDAITDAAG